MAMIRNPKLGTRNYIPPQFFRKYMFLSNECSDYRSRNKNMKTQMRFSDEDIVILVKSKGTA